MVLGMMMIFGITLVTVITYSSGTARDTKRAGAHDDALSVAEAGVANALSILSSAPRPLDSSPGTSALPLQASPQTDTVDGGTVTWYGTLPANSDTWTITARSTVRNPASLDGSGTLSRTVKVDAEVGSTTVNQAWNFVYSDSPGCLTLANSVVVKEPLYTQGDLCLNNSSSVTGSPVYVNGKVSLTGSLGIGSSGAYIANLYVGGAGCRYGSTGTWTLAQCAPAAHVYASTVSPTVPAITKPPIDLDYWYANAKPGPSQNCTSGSFPGGFDTDTTRNSSRTAVSLFASNYDCVVTVGGTQVGRIAYTSGNPGTLIIDGTIFFDGDINMTGSQKVSYSGRGTIYANGVVNLAGSQQICGAWSGGCDFTNWQPATSMLVFVSGDTGASSFTTGQSMQFQGGIYANGDYTQGSSVKIEGPKIAEAMSITGSSQSTFPAYTFLPPGAPQAKPFLTTNGWH